MPGVPNPPANEAQYIQEAAQGTGLPINVVKAQAWTESRYQTGAVSGTGAEGFWQFEPTTYNAYAAQSGVNPGSEFNIADETKVYITYMDALLKQEGGDIYKALEAYNAGPGNLGAGAGYASTIMGEAGVSQGAKAGSPTTQATLAGIHIPNPFDILKQFFGQFTNPVGSVLGALGSGILGAFGVASVKDMFQRLGLILLGVALIIVGLNMLSKSSAFSISPSSPEGVAAEASPVGREVEAASVA